MADIIVLCSDGFSIEFNIRNSTVNLNRFIMLYYPNIKNNNDHVTINDFINLCELNKVNMIIINRIIRKYREYIMIENANKTFQKQIIFIYVFMFLYFVIVNVNITYL
jgi:hypothetical protein